MSPHLADPEAPCAPRPIADSALGRVLLCPHCAQVHLQVGPLTLRLTPEAFAELAVLVGTACRRLEPAPAPQAAGAPAAWH